ncbi:DUF2157 domain-containing protein [Desulforamulus ruminis]|uniref:DUF2157 domain-containing protein n=1 Tax=Desulforamulus ruminis (strain ATCC 23193 / DSM 2154 / NCIMB 8452 / DL) TaxID=696281 RepID=F6DK68_DESRL|nr:DUF2157 domain-containing protein [Desulforamulus ruminis]AEG60382.1 Protein of unknown function DUF2157, membrane [Desulforamulus ruminis DSM 2154]
MKRQLTREQLQFLDRELQYQQERGVISEEQKLQMLTDYETKQGLSFIRIMLTIGALLVGLGILSFIASNWAELGKAAKLSIILAVFLGAMLASYQISGPYPKTSKSLLYIGVLTYGAGIFLIGQMFNFGGHFTGAFLLWALGAFPIAALFRDKLVYLFTCVLVIIYVSGYFALDGYPYMILALIPALYYCNRYLDHSRMILFFINLITLDAVLLLTHVLDMDQFYIGLLFFGLGLALYYLPLKMNTAVYRLQGTLVMGVAGLFLTLPEMWRGPLYPGLQLDLAAGRLASSVFAVALMIYLLYLTRKENLTALVFICAIIFRYYVDTFIDFMPKSAFFILGGLLLLGFGYYFERLRRKKGGLGVGQ